MRSSSTPQRAQRIGAALFIVVLTAVVWWQIKPPPTTVAMAPLPAITLPLPRDPLPADEMERYLAREINMDQPPAGGSSGRAMIAGTTNPFAIRAGLKVLQRGGSAVDAALTTSLAQVALNAGAAVSYAGVLTAVYYDASTRKVYTLNAAYNTVKGEVSPRTIPPRATPSGRSALVPGFMAGVQALHQRFGKVPFAELFEPAIWIAEHGVPLNQMVAGGLKSQRAVLWRLPETKRVFAKADGSLYEAGERFRQPELATTLRAVATRGADYMYRGAWARRFVELVQRDGGKMTLDDLAHYHVMWSEPAQITYNGVEVIGLGPPNFGVEMILGSLRLAELAELKKLGPSQESAEALYLQIQIARAVSRAAYRRGAHEERGTLLKPETTQRLWSEIKERGTKTAALASQVPNHSAGVVAVDEQGNVVSVLHSINTLLWGATGIFVDGVSIPDSAPLQIQQIVEAGPGARLAEATNPLLVLRNGKPMLASVAIGSALHSETLHHLLNILDFDLDPETSVQRPSPRGPFLGDRRTPDYEKEALGKEEFSDAIVEGVRARGQPIAIVGKRAQPGYWAGIRIDAERSKLHGGVSGRLNGAVEGY